jgi:glycine dehydrogenase
VLVIISIIADLQMMLSKLRASTKVSKSMLKNNGFPTTMTMMTTTMITRRCITSFLWRHLGPSEGEIEKMLEAINVADTEELIKKTIPNNLLVDNFHIGDPMSPHSLIKLFDLISKKNDTRRTFLGQGFYPTITPSFIMRNVLSNPGWYSPYTPYQSEISQGRLESLFNFQQLIKELTKLPIANASLLDEASAASEAMLMCYHLNASKRKDFIVDPLVFAQTIDVVKTIAQPLGINVIECNYQDITEEQMSDSFGVLVQYPNSIGDINHHSEYSQLVEKITQCKSRLITATDIMSLSLIKSPGEIGADIAIGNCQRFGVPMYYGGPHAAFISAKKEFLRLFPGKIVGESKDIHGNKTYRLAIQTR